MTPARWRNLLVRAYACRKVRQQTQLFVLFEGYRQISGEQGDKPWLFHERDSSGAPPRTTGRPEPGNTPRPFACICRCCGGGDGLVLMLFCDELWLKGKSNTLAQRNMSAIRDHVGDIYGSEGRTLIFSGRPLMLL